MTSESKNASKITWSLIFVAKYPAMWNNSSWWWTTSMKRLLPSNMFKYSCSQNADSMSPPVSKARSPKHLICKDLSLGYWGLNLGYFILSLTFTWPRILRIQLNIFCYVSDFQWPIQLSCLYHLSLGNLAPNLWYFRISLTSTWPIQLLCPSCDTKDPT